MICIETAVMVLYQQCVESITLLYACILIILRTGAVCVVL